MNLGTLGVWVRRGTQVQRLGGGGWWCLEWLCSGAFGLGERKRG